MAAPMSDYATTPGGEGTPVAQWPLPDEYFEYKYEFKDDASMNGTETTQEEKFTDSIGTLLLIFPLYVFECRTKHTYKNPSPSIQGCQLQSANTQFRGIQRSAMNPLKSV
jgi:hypothetical protein